MRTDNWLILAVILAGTLLAGWVVESQLGRVTVLLLYGVAGLAGEIAGFAWDPTGAGSSVGMLGLFAGVWCLPLRRSSWCIGNRSRLVGLLGASLAASLVGAALARSSIVLPVVFGGIVAGFGANLLRRIPAGVWHRGVAAIALAAAMALTLLHDNHGPAILAGFAGAVVLANVCAARKPGRNA